MYIKYLENINRYLYYLLLSILCYSSMTVTTFLILPFIFIFFSLVTIDERKMSCDVTVVVNSSSEVYFRQRGGNGKSNVF